jgi:hypothetical protein
MFKRRNLKFRRHSYQKPATLPIGVLDFYPMALYITAK